MGRETKATAAAAIGLLRADHVYCVNLEHPKYRLMATCALQNAGYTTKDPIIITEAYTQQYLGGQLLLEYYIFFCVQRESFLCRCVIDATGGTDREDCDFVKQTELLPFPQ